MRNYIIVLRDKDGAWRAVGLPGNEELMTKGQAEKRLLEVTSNITWKREARIIPLDADLLN